MRKILYQEDVKKLFESVDKNLSSIFEAFVYHGATKKDLENVSVELMKLVLNNQTMAESIFDIRKNKRLARKNPKTAKTV